MLNLFKKSDKIEDIDFNTKIRKLRVKHQELLDYGKFEELFPIQSEIIQLTDTYIQRMLATLPSNIYHVQIRLGTVPRDFIVSHINNKETPKDLLSRTANLYEAERHATFLVEQDIKVDDLVTFKKFLIYIDNICPYSFYYNNGYENQTFTWNRAK